MMKEELNTGVSYLKTSDPVLKKIIERHGECELRPSNTYFYNLVRSIISQQLSVKVAKTIFDRFLVNCLSITPENILGLSKEEMRSLGISFQKAGYIHSLAAFTIENGHFFEKINELTNNEIVDILTKINGIGLWTSQMFLIFSLNRLDILPLGDAGFRRSFKIVYQIANNSELDNEILRISNMWGKYKSVAVWYLWKDLDSNI